MENEASPSTIEEWINQLAREAHQDEYHSRIHSMRTNPVLKRIAAALDVRRYAHAGELADADSLHHHAEPYENDSHVFRHHIPMFAHTVHLPIGVDIAHAAMRPELRVHAVTARRCLASLREYCKKRKRKRQRLINALLFWRRKTLRYGYSAYSEWKPTHN